MPDAPTTTAPPAPSIDRRAIWRRLMDRAQAAQRRPTTIEPAGYQFTPEVIESMPAEVQTELALQLGKLVLDNSRLTKPKRIIPSPVPLDLAKARRGLDKALAVGRMHSRQGSTVAFAIREGSMFNPAAGSLSGRTRVLSRTEFPEVDNDYVAILPSCTSCNVTVSDPSMLTMVGTGLVCPVCVETDARECPGCHHAVLWYNMAPGPHGPICPACAERLMQTCPTCSASVERGQVRDGQCPRCVEDRFIHSYSHKPVPKFYIYPDTPELNAPSTLPSIWCMGVELETEIPRSITKAAKHAYDACRGIDDFIYAKHDGSLNYGIEYVSHPFSWEWLQGGGGQRWRDFLSKLRSTRHESYDPGSCGMHVHVTKAPFLNGPLLKLLRLGHNSPQMLLKLSRRDEGNLMQWSNPRGGRNESFMDIDAGFINSPTKYTAINVTTKTIEFRLFRGTLNETAFMGNLEAVKAMLDFSKVTTVEHPNETHFMEWMNRPENITSYPNMVSKLLRSTAKV